MGFKGAEPPFGHFVLQNGAHLLGGGGRLYKLNLKKQTRQVNQWALFIENQDQNRHWVEVFLGLLERKDKWVYQVKIVFQVFAIFWHLPFPTVVL